MKLRAFGRTNRSFGTGPWRPLAELIEIELPDFGDALHQIALTVYCNGDAPVRHSPLLVLLESLGGSTDFAPLQLTAKSTFFRKRRELRIQFPTTRFDVSDAAGISGSGWSREALREAKHDVRDAVQWAFNRSVKKADDFDTAAFLTWFDNWRGLDTDLETPISDLIHAAWSERTRRRALEDPWSLLDIKWSRMHPEARKILDRPEDWSQTDGLSPHGSDTGADIWSDWRRYARLTPEDAALRMGWNPRDPEARAVMARDWMEIHLALAFGQIKRNGRCPPDLATATVMLLNESLLNEELVVPERLQDWRDRTNRYTTILARYAAQNP